MPYTTIPTVSDGQVLTSSHLNLLGGNMAFLYGIANQANTPFNSYRATHVTLDGSKAMWDISHRVTFFHWKVTAGGNWNYCRVYYNGVVVGEANPGIAYSGVYNLLSWAGLPHLLGAWASGVAYEDDVHGDGNGGNRDDGHVVTQGGAYYKCILAHTSAAATQPGIGASWAAYWVLLTLPGINTMCVCWADVNFNSGTEVTVEYLIETDSVSL